MTEAEIKSFVAEGRLRLTNLFLAIRSLDDWSDSFTTRGGEAVYAEQAAAIAAISLKIQAAIEDADRATVAMLRTDV